MDGCPLILYLSVAEKWKEVGRKLQKNDYGGTFKISKVLVAEMEKRGAGSDTDVTVRGSGTWDRESRYQIIVLIRSASCCT
jgi:hypothetical protein